MRKLSFLLALCLLISLLPAAASAATVIDSGTCGENLTWTLDSDGLLTISGTGDMVPAQTWPNWPWRNYTQDIRTVVIEEGITSIGDRAFEFCNKMTSISLPTTLKSIHSDVFPSVPPITRIVIPASLEYLGEPGFGMGMYLDEIIVEQGNRYFKTDASGVLYSMDGKTLYTAPRNITGAYRIAEGTERIYPHAFTYCFDLEEVYFPASVRSVDCESFYYCYSMKKIQVSPDSLYFEHDENGLLYTRGREALCYVPSGKTGILTVDANVKRIEPYAVARCQELEGVILPEGVQTIGEYAFELCINLSEISLPAALTEIGAYAFMDCIGFKQLAIPEGVYRIGDHAFFNCESLYRVSFLGNTENIEQYAFAYCQSLYEISLPEGLSKLASGVFSGCTALEEVTIPVSLESIDGFAFSNCPLTTVRYGGTEQQWPEVTVSNHGNESLLNAKMRYLRVEEGFAAVRDGWNVINVHPSFGYSNDFYIDFTQYYAAGASFETIGKSVLTRFSHDWPGNCFGLSVLAVAHYNGQIDLRAYFDKEGDSLNEFGYETIMANTYGGETLQGNIYSLRGNEEIISVIERVQCSQYSHEIAAAEVFKLDTDYSEVLAYLNQENPAPLVIVVEGESPRALVEGHALVTDTTYKPVDMGDGQYLIVCYDCNAPRLTNPLAKGAARYDYPNSCVILDTTNGRGYYYLNNDLEIMGDNNFFARGVRFYDVRKLDPDFFDDMGLKLLGVNGVFVDADSYFAVKNARGEVLFELVDGFPKVHSQDVQYIRGAWDALEGEQPAVGYLALPAGTYTYTSSGDAAVVHVGADFTAAYEVDADAAVTVDDSQKKITVTNPTDTSGLTLKVVIADADVTVEASVEGALEREGSVSVCVNAHSKTAEVGSSIPPEDLKITAQVDGEVREDSLQLVHLHSWNEWEQTKDPNYLEDGEKTRSCVECGETETEVVDNNIFSDVKQDRFENAILWAYYEGITTGTGDGTTFSPENSCTRKQIVTFLWRAAGEPEPKSMENPFTDVKADRFEKAILWAYYEGITTGTGDGSTFSPENTCTRKQIVTFLWRFYDEPAPKNMENKFVDVKNDRFTAAILWAAEQGITTGTGDGSTFSPEAPCTRKQIVTFLYRAHQIGQPQALETDMTLPEQMRLLVK